MWVEKNMNQEVKQACCNWSCKSWIEILMSRNGNEIDHKNAGTLENHSEENREDRVLCEILMGVEEHRDSFMKLA